MNIYLIGMPGCGKTTLAKELSNKLNKEVIDLDQYIEQNAFLFISEIFEMYGETYFRDLESNMLDEVSKNNDVIISCGGGIVCKENNKNLFKGIKIFLDVDLEIIKNRLIDDDTRPLLKDNKLEELYEARYNKYLDFADIVLKNDECSVEGVIYALKEKGINY